MNKYFLVTVDCDLRCDDISRRRESLQILLDVFAANGIAGRATWFLNENDFNLTGNHPDFLHEILKRGDAIGGHDHVDFLDGKWEYSLIYDYCRKSRDRLESWLAVHGYDRPLTIHRFGCLFQHPAAYAAIGDLGYTILSDVYPGYKGKNHTGHLACDNTGVPAGIGPYRHGPDNFLDYESCEGCFLEMPCFHMGLSDSWGGRPDSRVLENWLTLAAKRSLKAVPVLWFFHPYEILTKDTKSISLKEVASLNRYLKEIPAKFGLKFASMDEYVNILGIDEID